eukprot:4429152-Amphidinium_carterae.2
MFGNGSMELIHPQIQHSQTNKPNAWASPCSHSRGHHADIKSRASFGHFTLPFSQQHCCKTTSKNTTGAGTEAAACMLTPRQEKNLPLAP